MSSRHTITEIGRKEDGVLEEPAGLPQLRNGDMLPADLRAFYRVCGGLALQKIRMRIVEPSRFLPVGGSTSRYLLAEKSDSSTGERIAIDLSPTGGGRCYAGERSRRAVVHLVPGSALPRGNLLALGGGDVEREASTNAQMEGAAAEPCARQHLEPRLEPGPGHRRLVVLRWVYEIRY